MYTLYRWQWMNEWINRVMNKVLLAGWMDGGQLTGLLNRWIDGRIVSNEMK